MESFPPLTPIIVIDIYIVVIVNSMTWRFMKSVNDWFCFSEPIVQMRPWLGIDHVNKAPKRTRYSYYEKAIKIYN